MLDERRCRCGVTACKRQGIVQVVDMPLLFETRSEGYMSRVIVVTCDRDTQLERLRQRNGLSATEAEARVAAQMPQNDKVAKAHFVVDNSGSKDATLAQVRSGVVLLCAVGVSSVGVCHCQPVR